MKMKNLFLILFVLILSLIAYASETDLDKSDIIFSHKKHVQEEEVECLDCHTEVEESLNGMDNLLPSMDVCADCHDTDDDENCGKCHKNPEDPESFASEITDYAPKFPHKTHLEKDIQCLDCHSTIPERDHVAAYVLPVMNDCITCHTKRLASRDCMTCHSESDDLRPLSHTKNYIHEHSDIAQNSFDQLNNDNSCANCHSENYCQDCHQGNNLDRMTHPLNFAFMHSLQAQGHERECSSCHVEKQFCSDCHRSYNIMPHTHKAGWTNTIPGDGGVHRIDAQNDIENCRACHEANASLICGNSGCHPNSN